MQWLLSQLHECPFRLLMSHLEAEVLAFKYMHPSLPYAVVFFIYIIFVYTVQQK